MNLNEIWDQFLVETNKTDVFNSKLNNNNEKIIQNISSVNIPKPSNLYISTKTIISYLNNKINLFDTFWKIPILYYHKQQEGVIKKQIKINSNSQEELDNLNKYIIKEHYIEQQVINHIENPSGKIKFKDIRKISVGISKKDILSYRCKKKGAFYNCFVIILRILDDNIYKEVHIKVFNTGKLEIPGIQKKNLLTKSLDLLIKILTPITNLNNLSYNKNNEITVLINSNFNCGFYIDREKLFNILRFDYGINSCYDPCSYPGIQCEFYYDINNNNNTGKKIISDNNNVIKISFMIFRTGSVLIVGKCNEEILNNIYIFIKNLLIKEFYKIATKLIENTLVNKIKKKNKKKFIYLTKQ